MKLLTLLRFKTMLKFNRISFFSVIGIATLFAGFSGFAKSEEVTKKITLSEALELMNANHPRIHAAEASLRGSEAGLRGVQNLPLFAKLSPDMKYRKQQSTLGIEVADAGLRQEIRDTSYGVARGYFLVVYSKQQQDLSKQVLDILGKNIKALELKMALKKTPEDEIKLQKLKLGFVEAKHKNSLAVTGYERAKALLTEEVGGRKKVGLIEPIEKDFASYELLGLLTPEFIEEMVEKTVVIREEVIKSSKASQILALEVNAQKSARFNPKFRTFASGSDLHYIPIGVQGRGENFTPEAITIEMPSSLVGKKNDRVARAQAFADRGAAVEESTKNLIRLEVRNAFQLLLETRISYNELKKVEPELKKIITELHDTSLKFLNTDNAELFEKAGKMLGNYNHTKFITMDNLADLERITSGTFSVGLTCPATITNDGKRIK
ncbi:MAG: TolC family protein [Planctomycetota bacterium]|nr:MAG: TolC family protein [Planctomycetota bacterium]RLS86163.1 MAG: TolC family protein [Planctomycetota bacterium]